MVIYSVMITLTRWQEVTDLRDYQVMSSGHGSSYRFDGLDPHKPTLPNKTLFEAFMEGVKWERTADTIAGRAQIYRNSTRETIALDEAAKTIKGAIVENIGTVLEPFTAHGLYELTIWELLGMDAREVQKAEALGYARRLKEIEKHMAELYQGK